MSLCVFGLFLPVWVLRLPSVQSTLKLIHAKTALFGVSGELSNHPSSHHYVEAISDVYQGFIGSYKALSGMKRMYIVRTLKSCHKPGRR